MKPENYNPTCLITGRKDNLRMHPLRNGAGAMIGWLFLHESVGLESINADIQWSYQYHIKGESPDETRKRMEEMLNQPVINPNAGFQRPSIDVNPIA